ncbi:MAG: hypothetical protein Rhob2KO_53610 [Rhodopirellula baltica]
MYWSNEAKIQSDNGGRHRAAREKLTIRKRDDAAPVHGMVIRYATRQAGR